MSTCPEADLHSVYIDNELPEQYKAGIESHLAQCPECEAHFEKMKFVHDALRQDAAQSELSQEEIDAGFERLMARKSYHKVVSSRNDSNVISFVLRMAPAVAAALVLAFVLPVRLAGINESSAFGSRLETAFANSGSARQLQQVSQFKKSGVAIDPNLSNAQLASLFESGSSTESADAVDAATKFTTSLISSALKASGDGSMVSILTDGSGLATIDIFRPEFPDNSITIGINMGNTNFILGNENASKSPYMTVSYSDVFK